jgi:sigma-B regulation protein RsbU (phosphoserine phosphatase)
VNAGHNPPLIYRRSEHRAVYLPRGGRALGWFPDNPLKPLQFQLQEGDVMVFYTDGLTEAENSAGEYFGEARLARALERAAAETVDGLLNSIEHEVDAFCGDVPAFDDLTLCAVRCVDAASP